MLGLMKKFDSMIKDSFLYMAVEKTCATKEPVKHAATYDRVVKFFNVTVTLTNMQDIKI